MSDVVQASMLNMWSPDCESGEVSDVY